jgi:L-asparaginase / beta-aspartyl-peptidase
VRLIVHGGAGGRAATRRKLAVLEEALRRGASFLSAASGSLEAVVAALGVMEDSGAFNAGAGGNLQLDGIRRLDASLMEGAAMQAGAVIGLEGVLNPSLAARAVMDLPHVILTNRGASKIARAGGLSELPPPGGESLRRLEKARRSKKELMSLYRKYFGTVGAVAVDEMGNVAAGASTGGVPGMLPGRVGDTPLIGCGVYAENSLGAVACTGLGEYIVRLAMAKEICMHMGGVSPYRAAVYSLTRLKGLGGEAGVIVIGRDGRFTILHTTEHMASGYTDGKKVVVKTGFRRV